MGMKKSFVALSALAGSVAFTAGFSALAAATVSETPRPPSQICVNNKCAATPVAAAPVAATGTHAIKWNPGHYMASGSVLYGGRNWSMLQSEMDDINNQDAFVGYRVWITWGLIEPSKGVYDFSQIDAVLARLKTAYNKPKHLVIGLWLYGQGAKGSNDASVLPLYIQNDSQYGASPVAGSYGWWGKNSNGKSTGMYAPALYNPAVMNRFIAAIQAMGAHYDGDAYVEGMYVQEDATIAEAASAFPPVDPLYSDGSWLTQLERLLSAGTSAFPHSNVIAANSWFDRPPSTVALTEWMSTNRVSPGSSDSWGQSALSSLGTSNLSDGIQVYLGTDQYGGVGDLRGKMSAMMEVQTADVMGNYFSKYGGPWTPLDLINAFNQTYYASHVFWTHFFGTEIEYGVPVPAVAKWSNLAATCAANPLTHTSYPTNYP